MTTHTTPNYNHVNVSCSNCGNHFQTRSTHQGNIRVEVCSNCHPAYTGVQRTVTNSGRVEQFRERYNNS